MHTFPFLKTPERTVLRYIIQSIWDIGFGVALYEEIIIRLKRREKKLFPSKKIIDKSIRQLCKTGILKSEMSEFGDGSPGKWKKVRVLKLPKAFREQTLNVMAEA